MTQNAVQALSGRLGKATLWALFLVPPVLVVPTAEDAFRLPKLAASEVLALLSLLFLSWRWWTRGRLGVREILARPVTAFAGLLALGAASGWLTTQHPEPVRRALVSLLVALGCLLIWSLHLQRHELRRSLTLLLVPATILSLLAILQRHGIYDPFDFEALEAGRRLAIGSLAGNVGELAAYLVLPLLLAQAAWVRSRDPGRRAVALAVIALLTYALLLTQTLVALAAALAASGVFWWTALRGRRRWLLLPLVPVAAILVAGAPGVRWRVRMKLEQLSDGRLSELLSGRPDAWKAALAMFREEPWAGVGHGGFGARFAETKLRLLEAGESFYSRGDTAAFVNAHNEYLEVAAEWGLVGILALVVALGFALWRLAKLVAGAGRAEEAATALAGSTALAVLALGGFPLRAALTGYPWVLFASWIFAGQATDAGVGARGRLRGWHLAALLTLVLLPALCVHALGLRDRLQASRVLRTTSRTARLAQARGRLSRSLLQANLRALRRAAELDPLAVGIPMTAGSHYLLLGNHAAALEWYQRAMALEPKPNLHLNLARALLMAGRREEAAGHLAAAVALDPSLQREAAALGWSPGGR